MAEGAVRVTSCCLRILRTHQLPGLTSEWIYRPFVPTPFPLLLPFSVLFANWLESCVVTVLVSLIASICLSGISTVKLLFAILW